MNHIIDVSAEDQGVSAYNRNGELNQMGWPKPKITAWMKDLLRKINKPGHPIAVEFSNTFAPAESCMLPAQHKRSMGGKADI